MRTQNEGTGKSSWWVINPDAKPGKSPRRRAQSMDTKSYEKKRRTAKIKADKYRALGMENMSTPEDLDLQSSPQDQFRHRTSSNASSVGRLSPIPSLREAELTPDHMISPHPWSATMMDHPPFHKEPYPDSSLAENFADMIVSTDSTGLQSYQQIHTPSPLQQLSPASVSSNGFQDTLQHSPQLNVTSQPPNNLRMPTNMGNIHMQSQGSHPAFIQLTDMATQYNQIRSNNPDPMMNPRVVPCMLPDMNQSSRAFPEDSTSLLMRQLVSPKPLTSGNLQTDMLLQASADVKPTASVTDLDMIAAACTPESFLSCDIEQVLNHEMTFDDSSFDFAFEPQGVPQRT